jgi:FtsH-binding integral membrane protein
MVNSSLYNRFIGRNIKQNGGGDLVNILYEKKTFLVKTFATLIVQLGITYYVMEKTPNPASNNKNSNQNKMVMHQFLFGGILIILILAFVPMPSWIKLLLFTLFSYLTGRLLSIVKSTTTTNLINTALIGTISVFGIMCALGMTLIAFGIKLGIRTLLILLICLLLLILFQIVFIFSGASSSEIQKIIVFFGLILFSLYVIYDTNKILQRNYYGDFITASLDYYLDIINIFMNLISLDNFN